MNWLENPLVWLFLLPALAVSGVLAQMVASLFSCCGTFTLQGRTIHLKWWMIPCASLASGMLWLGVVLLIIFTDT